jgi:hypothetical protein
MALAPEVDRQAPQRQLVTSQQRLPYRCHERERLSRHTDPAIGARFPHLLSIVQFSDLEC